jgi:hypothetical protein
MYKQLAFEMLVTHLVCECLGLHGHHKSDATER